MKSLISLVLALTITLVDAKAQPAVDGGQEGKLFGQVGRARVIMLPEPADLIAVGDDKVADFKRLSKRELYILGKSVGQTNLVIRYPGGRVSMLNVEIGIDIEPVRQVLRDSLPEEDGITITAAGASLVIGGVVSNALASEAALSLVDAYSVNLNRYLQQDGQTNSPAASLSRDAALDGSSSISGTGLVKVINLMKIRDPQQVMLEVRIAEISKAITQQIGFSFLGSGGGGLKWTLGSALTETPLALGSLLIGGTTTTSQNGSSNSVNNNTDSVVNSNNVLNQVLQNSVSSSGTSTATTVTNPIYGGAGTGGHFVFDVNGRPFDIDFEAERKNGLVKILAQPTIVAISGQQGSFLAGGRIYIPVTQSTGEGPAAYTLEEKEFGVGLKFTPTVLDGGRISLRVEPEISELAGQSVSYGFNGNSVLPAFTTTKVSTTVQMLSGQSLIIGGLLKNNLTQSIRSIPILGQIPILGALFRSSAYKSDKTELVVMVRATLVSATDQAPRLPTDNLVEPTSREFFLEGRFEGRPKKASEDEK